MGAGGETYPPACVFDAAVFASLDEELWGKGCVLASCGPTRRSNRHGPAAAAISQARAARPGAWHHPPNSGGAMARAWSLLTILDRQHGGNEGYDDRAESHYSFDSTVPNAARVSEGDWAVLRDSAQLLGLARIQSIETTRGHKKRRRCPKCATTDFKRRSSLLPANRCKHGHTFDASADEMIAVTFFRANYGGTWLPLRGHLSADALEHMTVSRARQHSIREIDTRLLRQALGDVVPANFWTLSPFKATTR